MLHRFYPIFCLLWLLLPACGSPGEKDLQLLLKRFKSEDPTVRNRAALDSADYGIYSAKVVPPLIKLLSDENNGVRSGAAYALRKLDTVEGNRALDIATKKGNR